MEPLRVIGRVALVLFGLSGVIAVLTAAVQTFVVPRPLSVALARAVWGPSRRFFTWVAGRRERRHGALKGDQFLALYAPVTLMVMLAVWLAVLVSAFTAIFFGLDDRSLRVAFNLAGSSLFTLGFERPTDLPSTAVAFSAAAIGVGLVAIFVAYLPSIYAAFARREAAVALLEVRAGSPPSAETMVLRLHRIGMEAHFEDLWVRWEEWFVDLDESHTSLAPLAFFRSPQPERSWVTAAGAVLDAAALTLACLEQPNVPQAHLTLRSGFIALRRIADYFAIPYDPHPAPGDPIAVDRSEFDATWDRLAEAGLPMKPDRDAAWLDFAGWRVNYDAALIGIASIVGAPPAPWSGDRTVVVRQPPLFDNPVRRRNRRPGSGRLKR